MIYLVVGALLYLLVGLGFAAAFIYEYDDSFRGWWEGPTRQAEWRVALLLILIWPGLFYYWKETD